MAFCATSDFPWGRDSGEVEEFLIRMYKTSMKYGASTKKKAAASSTQFCLRAIKIFVQEFRQRGVKFLGVVDLKVGREFEGLRNNCCI
jgi:hypothetical protein